MLGIVIGTGPSLAAQIPTIHELRKKGAMVFGVNNTFEDIELDAWIACDPEWHDEYSPVDGDFERWHWDEDICNRFGYTYIEGRWFDGLSTDESWISYNHCSSAQALNLAVHYGAETILLVGHDFSYQGGRHYFVGLSEQEGEYPSHLRKWSTFDGLIETYRHIGEQEGLPEIINCTQGSALPWFPFGSLEDYL